MAFNMPTISPVRWRNSTNLNPNPIFQASDYGKETAEISTELLRPHAAAVHLIHHALKEAKHILIAGHEHPDGDAIGSSLSLWHALRLQNKQVTVFMPDPAPDMFSFVPGFKEISTAQPNTADYDAVVLLDSTYLERTHLADAVRIHPLSICLDHHHDNRGECVYNLIVPSAAATAHIMTIFFQATQTPITKDMATCLLTGIFTDTGSFMHDATTPEILKIAAYLMRKGARLSHIAHETYQKRGLSSLKIWGRALSRIITNKLTGATVSIITAKDMTECNANLDDLSGLVNMLNSLPDTKFALLLTEYAPGKIKGSLRSEPNKNVDVSQIAKLLGGGGHKLAAGFELEGHLTQKDGKWRVETIQNPPPARGGVRGGGSQPEINSNY